LLLAYQGFERGVATFYDLPGIPAVAPWRKSFLDRHGQGRLGRPRR